MSGKKEGMGADESTKDVDEATRKIVNEKTR